MNKKKLIIVGLSTTADHVYEFVKMYDLFDVIGFAVNEHYKIESEHFGYPVYSLENLYAEVGHQDFYVFISLLWNKLNKDRRLIYEYCQDRGYKMANIISPNAIIRGNLKGDNCWIHDNVIIQNGAQLESNIAVMAFTLIGANSHIESHCFFGARSLLGGGCIVGQQSFIGINSTIFDDTKIGDKCIIGACTAVKRNMPNFSKYTIKSDNIEIKQYLESEIEDKLLYSKNIR